MRKSENYLFFRKLLRLRSQSCLKHLTNELMKLSEYQRSRSFFDLGQSHSDFKVKCLTIGLYTQVSDSGPLGPLVLAHLSTKCSTVMRRQQFVLKANSS